VKRRTYGRLPQDEITDAERVIRFLYLAHLNRRQTADLLGIHPITVTRYNRCQS
jgi:hypothetical protein